MFPPHDDSSMLKKLWADPVWSKVIATVIIASGAALLGFFFDWWPAIWTFGKEASNLALSRTLLPNWLVGILGLSTMILIVRLIVAMWQETTSPSSSEKWRNYCTDEFFGLRWRWSFFENGQPYELSTFCPKCDFQLYGKSNSSFTSGFSGTTFNCDHCGKPSGVFQESSDELEDFIKRRIQQKVRTGAWDRSPIEGKATTYKS